MAFSLGTCNPMVSNVASITSQEQRRRPELGTCAPFLFHRLNLEFGVLIPWRPLHESADVAFRTVRRSRARAHHLGEQIHVVISFAGHRFANLVQHSQKFWSS